MITFSLQSGSNGNCIFVEAGNKRLLFDAGISGRQVRMRLEQHQRSVRDIDALLISHDHTDHAKHAGVYERLWGIPSYMTGPTHEKVKPMIGKARMVKRFEAGQTLTFDDVLVHTIPTPHDAVDGVAFVVEHEGRRLGILTDLGHPFAALSEAIKTVDAVYLESNYDPHLLETGPYPIMVQNRIRGEQGHISNAEAAELLKMREKPVQWVALAHISHHNNTADVALETHRQILGDEYPLTVATRHSVSSLMTVRESSI